MSAGGHRSAAHGHWRGNRMTQFAGRFSGRTAVITGGASGLGKAVAHRIARVGGAVALWDVNRAGRKAARADVAAVHIAEVDVSDRAAVVRAAKEAYEKCEHIDILVNSAGIT